MQIAGGSVSLPCSAVGSPPPQLSWIFNGRTLYTDTKFQILSGKQKDLYTDTKFQILSGRQKDFTWTPSFRYCQVGRMLNTDTKFQILSVRQDPLHGHQVLDIVR